MLSGAFGASQSSGTGVFGSTKVGFGAAGSTRYLSDFLLSVALGSGRYWLVLHNSTGATYWETANLEGYSAAHSSVGEIGQDFAFELYNESVVPEPATVVLLGTGLFSLGLVNYRRRKSRQDPS